MHTGVIISLSYLIGRLGSWQFMTDMPYTTVSKETMWLLLWSVHQGRGQKVTTTNVPSEEECRRFVAGENQKPHKVYHAVQKSYKSGSVLKSSRGHKGTK